MWADVVFPLRYPPYSSFNVSLLRHAILRKGPIISALRTLGSILRGVRNLGMLYFMVVGFMVTFRQWADLSPDA